MLEMDLQAPELADRLEISPSELDGLLKGSQPITLSLARALSSVIGGTTDFWIARDAQYIDSRERVESDRWAAQFPIKTMVELKWISAPADWIARIDVCKNFFDVDSLARFDERYDQLVQSAQYRQSKSYAMDRFAVAAWFRSCEIAADNLKIEHDYDPESFEASMGDIRRLTLSKDPKYFIPRLTELCASSGVAVVLVRAPQGCPTSGAVREYCGRPLIQLSGRHLSDDQLWFTFFHESGHVLRHGLEIPFLDTDDETGSAIGDSLEQEANEFARKVLLNDFDARKGPQSYREVLRLATTLGIAPGILVGQLQHAGRIPLQNLNKLKRRYVWNGPNLEMSRND